MRIKHNDGESVETIWRNFLQQSSQSFYLSFVFCGLMRKTSNNQRRKTKREIELKRRETREGENEGVEKFFRDEGMRKFLHPHAKDGDDWFQRPFRSRYRKVVAFIRVEKRSRKRERKKEINMSEMNLDSLSVRVWRRRLEEEEEDGEREKKREWR